MDMLSDIGEAEELMNEYFGAFHVAERTSALKPVIQMSLYHGTRPKSLYLFPFRILRPVC